MIIPAGFTASILPDASGKTGEVVMIEVYANPARPIGAGVVQSIVAGFLSQVETGQAGGRVTAEQLMQSGRADGLQAMQAAMEIGGDSCSGPSSLSIDQGTGGSETCL